MAHDDEPPREELPIRCFRPPIRFRQDPPALPEPLIRQVQDDEFTVLPDLLPVAPVVEAQENIAAMFEKGQTENQMLNSLDRRHREQYRQLLLWCGGNRSCTLAEVYQRTATSPWLVRSTRAKVRRYGQWRALGSLAVAFPPGSSGADFELSLHCACTPTAVTTSPGELIRRAVHEPGTHIVTE